MLESWFEQSDIRYQHRDIVITIDNWTNNYHSDPQDLQILHIHNSYVTSLHSCGNGIEHWHWVKLLDPGYQKASARIWML